MSKKFNTIKESIEHTLNNTVFPDSVIHYMAHGDKKLIKQMKKQRDELTHQAKQSKTETNDTGRNSQMEI